MWYSFNKSLEKHTCKLRSWTESISVCFIFHKILAKIQELRVAKTTNASLATFQKHRFKLVPITRAILKRQLLNSANSRTQVCQHPWSPFFLHHYCNLGTCMSRPQVWANRTARYHLGCYMLLQAIKIIPSFFCTYILKAYTNRRIRKSHN